MQGSSNLCVSEAILDKLVLDTIKNPFSLEKGFWVKVLLSQLAEPSLRLP